MFNRIQPISREHHQLDAHPQAFSPAVMDMQTPAVQGWCAKQSKPNQTSTWICKNAIRDSNRSQISINSYSRRFLNGLFQMLTVFCPVLLKQAFQIKSKSRRIAGSLFKHCQNYTCSPKRNLFFYRGISKQSLLHWNPKCRDISIDPS